MAAGTSVDLKVKIAELGTSPRCDNQDCIQPVPLFFINKRVRVVVLVYARLLFGLEIGSNFSSGNLHLNRS